MTIDNCYLYVKNRLNKLSTNSGDNLPKHQFVDAFNACQLHWVEDRIKVDETNIVRKDEINQLLKPLDLKPLKPTSESNFYEVDLPEDYFHYKRTVSLTPCEVINHLKSEGDINVLLNDSFWKPSLEWGETICTLVGKKLRVYVDNFSIQKIEGLYYRYPVKVDMSDGFTHLDGSPTQNIDPEFEGSSLMEILNMTTQLLAGDTTDQWNYQTMAQRNQQYT